MGNAFCAKEEIIPEGEDDEIKPSSI